MAVRILEMDRQRIDNRSYDMLRALPFAVEQAAITPTGVSQQSAAFGAGTVIVVVQADEDVHVSGGAAPEATADSFKLRAGETEDFWVAPGHKLAVLAAS